MISHKVRMAQFIKYLKKNLHVRQNQAFWRTWIHFLKYFMDWIIIVSWLIIITWPSSLNSFRNENYFYFSKTKYVYLDYKKVSLEKLKWFTPSSTEVTKGYYSEFEETFTEIFDKHGLQKSKTTFWLNTLLWNHKAITT